MVFKTNTQLNLASVVPVEIDLFAYADDPEIETEINFYAVYYLRDDLRIDADFDLTIDFVKKGNIALTIHLNDTARDLAFSKSNSYRFNQFDVHRSSYLTEQQTEALIEQISQVFTCTITFANV